VGTTLCLLLLAGSLPWAATGCGPRPRTAEETILAFLEAVQSQDLETLYCLMAGAAEAAELGAEETERRANFESWALAHHAAYLEERDEGWVELDEQGLKLVRLFALGRGTFFSHRSVRAAARDVRVIESDIRFGYAHIDLSGFSPGTTFYVCGTPVGRVRPIRIPSASDEVTVEVLTEVRVEWTLVKAEPTAACAGGWTVASVAPVEGSEVASEITWVF
jgi:hypothetical protein